METEHGGKTEETRGREESGSTEGVLGQISEFLVPLRGFLTRAALLFGGGFILAWIFREDLTALLRWPLISAFPEQRADTILLRVMDLFMVHVKICVYVSLFALGPVLLLDGWSLLRRVAREKGGKIGWFAPLVSVFLFFLGLGFAFVVVLPYAFRFLVAYSLGGAGVFVGEQAAGMDWLQVSMKEHVSLTMGMVLAFGLGFQAPLVMSVLARTGLVRAADFARWRGVALVVLAVASAVLTPPDPWTMVLLLLPMYVLYEFGIVWARLVGKRKMKTREESAGKSE